MSPEQQEFLNSSLGLLVKRGVLTRAFLNNANSMLPIEATLNDGCTTDHISADMAAITCEAVEAISAIRRKHIGGGTPPTIVSQALDNAFEAISYFHDQLTHRVYTTHAATVKQRHAYINSNLADSKGVIETLAAVVAMASESSD